MSINYKSYELSNLRFMVGIIYKFTILAGVKYFGCKPFYIGQHYDISNEEFLSIYNNYIGSGVSWVKRINELKSKQPEKWRHFIKREILYSGKDISQAALDALEKHYIKKYKSHYSFRKGGCNILIGTANNFGSGSPMKDPQIAYKVTSKLKGRKGAKRSDVGKINMKIAAKKSWENNFKRKELARQLQTERMKNGGADNLRKKFKGRKFTEDWKRKISENHADFSGEKHPRFGVKYIWITNGIKNKCWSGDCNNIPDGYYRGKIQNGKIYKK